MSDGPAFHSGGGSAVLAMLDEMTDLYRAVYAEPPYNSGPLWSDDLFRLRTEHQARRDGFRARWARSGAGDLVGFAFGFGMGAGGWWGGGDADLPPEEILAGDKFAVIELIVDRAWRGQGIGRRLLDELLAGRPEPYAMLTAVPAAPARALYDRWGWRQVGTARHTPDSPVMDQLVLRLDA